MHADTLDYSKLIHLDAEELAEGGIREAYDSLMPELRRYVPQPRPIEEEFDTSVPSYSVSSGGRRFEIFSPKLLEEVGEASWVRATHALFTIINEQMHGTAIRFYAINGGNDLRGIFLTEAQAVAVRATLPRNDWPYIPTDEPEWGGAHH